MYQRCHVSTLNYEKQRRTNMSTALAKIDFDKEQMAVIESQFFPQGATKAEQQYCFSVARELNLNPITKEIFFVNRRQKVGDKWVNKVEPMVGRDGFLSIAHRTNQFAGIETSASIREVPVLEGGGQWRMKQQLVAECSVWRKDSPKPLTVQVTYNEYCQKTTEGTPTRFWAEKPETMLKKVAESQALRKAFNIHGVYSPEELGAGIEWGNGDIIEADCTRIEADKSYLSIVKAPEQETPQVKPRKRQPVALPPPEPDPEPGPEPGTSDDGWPDLPQSGSQITDDAALQIIDLLEGKHIPYDIITDGDETTISASSFNEKDLLKSSGFRWSSDLKRWVYRFTNEPC
jgi:phage recombination protein Bet